MTDSAVDSFAARLRARQALVGYWVMCDNPVGTERLAGLGYDYVCVDAQHGLLDYRACLSALTVIDARGRSAGIVRVPANDPAEIGRMLDAGARGVIVPLVNSAEEAAAAVAACRYPPTGVRSYGPMRAGLRVGPRPADADAAVVCVVMIETATGLAAVDDIAATPGVDGIYAGPSDLALALGAEQPGDPAIAAELRSAMLKIAGAAADAGIAAGAHCRDGASAAAWLADGFTFATVSSDLIHLEQAAAQHLDAARKPPT